MEKRKRSWSAISQVEMPFCVAGSLVFIISSGFLIKARIQTGALGVTCLFAGIKVEAALLCRTCCSTYACHYQLLDSCFGPESRSWLALPQREFKSLFVTTYTETLGLKIVIWDVFVCVQTVWNLRLLCQYTNHSGKLVHHHLRAKALENETQCLDCTMSCIK